jgi:hypothetical protein
MKFMRYALGAVTAAISLQSNACLVFLQDNIQVPLNSSEVSNSDRLSLTRHYLTAREWTAEGASAEVDAAAFDSESNPQKLAALRGKKLKAFLVQLGLGEDKIDVRERVIQLRNHKIDPDDKWQIGVEFIPNCPSSGCQSLCNISKLQGVVSHAVTADTPGPAPGSNSFTCGDKREPTKARIVEAGIWTTRTEEKSLTLIGDDSFGTHGPLAGVCYRVTTSAREYIGMTDDRGHTGRMQLLGPERTKIEMKVDADQYPVRGGD